jgi:hypothetical protein
MTSPRYLTKSRFRLAIDCPTKLFYTRKKDEYADKSLDDDFLKALAKGGIQVGELAKHYYPGGTDITTMDHEEAIKQTQELIMQESVILYEPAFRFENLFIRVDVLVKQGNNIKLIEVKAKSFGEETEFIGKRGGIISKWKPYLYDVAFQKYVLQKSHPELKVTAYLMLADKSKTATVDELFGKFLIKTKSDGSICIEVTDPSNLGDKILTTENVDDIADLIINGKEDYQRASLPFPEYVKALSDAYFHDKRILERINSACKKCQFRLSEPVEDGLKSGFHECLQQMANAKEEDLQRPTIFDVWYSRSDKVLRNGVYFQDQLSADDLAKPKEGLDYLDMHQRQLLQVNYAQSKENKPYIDKAGLAREIENLQFPLNFIDFETTMVPIPFFKGNRPYEQIAYQFSHHTMEENGKINHEEQYLHAIPGEFPNFHFVRELKKSLEKNNGAIFRYADHENNILNAVYRQLDGSCEPDKEELKDWISTITSRSSDGHIGERNMIDQLEWVKKYYWHPLMGGSNSIKAVLPVSLTDSDYLRTKYSQPIYGTDVIFSHNLTNHIWIKEEDGQVVSPYKQLPKLFQKWDRDLIDTLLQDGDNLQDGGAAMTAYNYMQFRQMSDAEREETKTALLRYCELDTFAMVMIFEYWRDLVEL